MGSEEETARIVRLPASAWASSTNGNPCSKAVMAAKLAVAAAAKATNPVMLALESAAALRAATECGAQKEVLAAAKTRAAADVGDANAKTLNAFSRAGGQGLVLAGAKTQSYEAIEAANPAKRYALAQAGALQELTLFYTNMSLRQLSLAKDTDWRAANLCHLGDKLFQAGMQAPPDELLEYGSRKVEFFFTSDPGRGKSVIRYMEALAKTHGADAGSAEEALFQLGTKTLQLFANSHRLRIALKAGSWDAKTKIAQEANRQVLAQVLAQVVAVYSSGGTCQQNESVPVTWQECVAAAVAKDLRLAVNVVGKWRNATEEETATLRHALDNAGGVLENVKWADLTAALAQVTNYERKWNKGHKTVKNMAMEIRQLHGKKRKRAS
jgi:hypothetical protein